MLRDMVRETELSASQLVYPMFIELGTDSRTPIESMPGIERLSISHAVEEAGSALALGVPAVLLFGIPTEKDVQASGAYDPEGVVQLALADVTAEVGDELVVMTDLCLDEYTDHGHCGVLLADGTVDNDATLERYASIALAQAEAGAAVVAPSGMMDGQVGAIRAALDGAGHGGVAVMAYAAKYASCFYGPFRDAAECAPRFGDRAGYQMDPANGREALREAALDEDEGADILMVKPAMSYLDVVAAVRAQTTLPVAAYQVSGEYAMIKAAAERGWLDERRVVAETILSIKRAGADLVLTYFARDVAAALE